MNEQTRTIKRARSGTITGDVNRRDLIKSLALDVPSSYVPNKVFALEPMEFDSTTRHFLQPPDDACPWVYWYFTDGHLTREGMEADLEAVQKAGIKGVNFLRLASVFRLALSNS